MKIAFHLTTPPPPVPELDAAVQEVRRLQGVFGGSVSQLYPAASYRPWIPRGWLRADALERLAAADAKVDLHHFTCDRPFGHRALRRLERPLVCRLLTCPTAPSAALARLRPFRAVVVSSPADAARLEAWGVAGVSVIPPGLDLERFRAVEPPPADLDPFTVLMASAPWTRRQFVTKGVEALLAAVRGRPHLRLLLLWRGALEAEIERRIRRAGLAGRVELVTETVDVTRFLGRSHVVALATTSPRVVKAYPHSLLEGLAAGRPVLTSPQVSLGELVEERGCGVVADCDAEALGAALDRLRADYEGYRSRAGRLDLGRLSPDRHERAWRELFSRVAGGDGVSSAGGR